VSKKLDIDETYWWEKIDEYIMEEIRETKCSPSEYFGNLQILFIDQVDFEEKYDRRLRFHNMVTFDEVKKLEKWIGRDEVKKWENGYQSLSKKENIHDTAIYVSTEEDYVYATHLTMTKNDIFDYLQTDCDECMERVTFSESKQIDDDDEWIRLCKQCQ